MKRIRRWVFIGIIVLSTALCVGATALWVRSYFRMDELARTDHLHVWQFTSEMGSFWIQREVYPILLPPSEQDGHGGEIRIPDGWQYDSFDDPDLMNGMMWWSSENLALHSKNGSGIFSRWGGFGVATFRAVQPEFTTPNDIRTIIIPYWLIVAFSLPFPVFVFRRTWKFHRALKSNCCTQCGYDLRATPNQCPECGKMADRKRDSNEHAT